MSEQQKRNQRLVLIVFAMSLIPFIIAWMFANNPQWLSGKTNKGNLIIPPVTTERSELTGFDQFSIDNLSQLNGHWVMINVIQGNRCAEFCREAIHKTKQLRLMMNKDLTRIRRVVLISGQIDAGALVDIWQDDDRLLRARANATLLAKLRKITGGEIPEGMMFLMDPLGNLMMYYDPGFDPYDVKADLSKLLRISQIG